MTAPKLFRSLFVVLGIFALSATMFADSSVRPSVENGDYNGDGSRNLTDAINMFQYLFTDRATPAVPAAAHCDIVDTDDGSKVGHYASRVQNGDVNGDEAFDLTDCIYFLNWLFAGGAEPVEIDCALPGSSP